MFNYLLKKLIRCSGYKLFFIITLLLMRNVYLFAQISATITEINPNTSTLDDPDGPTGGRVNGLAVTSDGSTLYAASEWGGIYKSTDSGLSWFRLDNHVPTATWDVAVEPTNPNKVYATSFYDGRVNSLAGINVSNNGGNAWAHPATATPPGGTYTTAARRNEPSAFGISIDPDAPQNVYVGTNAGLAISNDAGATWRYVDPTPGDLADNIWGVIVHDGGIIDLVGDDGHQRSADGGNTWTTATTSPLPSGMGSITVSPDEPYVLFAVRGTTIYESDDGGASWPTVLVNPSPQGRIPFVRTNQRAGTSFDLWFGDVRLWRATCTTPASPAPGGAPRAPTNSWNGPFITGGHADVGDIVFDPTVTLNACPVVYSSDGGVYVNTKNSSPDCHLPVWKQPDVTPRGLWLWGMGGAAQPGIASEDLYFGTQDNGVFGTLNAGVATPSWIFKEPGDIFDVAAVPDLVQYTLQGGKVILNLRQRGFANGAEINPYPSGNIAGFTFGIQCAWFCPERSVLLTKTGAFVTNDITANPIVWTEIGSASKPPNEQMCSVKVATSGGIPTFYVRTKSGSMPGQCNGRTPDKFWRFTGTSPAGTWVQVNPPGGIGGFGVFAVNPRNPNHLIASHLGTGANPRMILSNDGGANWTSLANLDNLMMGGGVFKYANQRGPTSFTSFQGYPQPSLVAISPHNSNIIVAGGVDSGIFVTVDGGSSWNLVTDPTDPGSSGTPHIPRPKFAHFGDEPPEVVNIFIGTQGRGVWKITLHPSVLAAEGRITLLRVHDLGTRYGPPTDEIDVEAVIKLDSKPDMAFGFQLRNDASEGVHRDMLNLLRDAFNHDRRVRIDYILNPGKRNGRLIRVRNIP